VIIVSKYGSPAFQTPYHFIIVASYLMFLANPKFVCAFEQFLKTQPRLFWLLLDLQVLVHKYPCAILWQNTIPTNSAMCASILVVSVSKTDFVKCLLAFESRFGALQKWKQPHIHDLRCQYSFQQTL
jgi:hypothetical protein